MAEYDFHVFFPMAEYELSGNINENFDIHTYKFSQNFKNYSEVSKLFEPSVRQWKHNFRSVGDRGDWL